VPVRTTSDWIDAEWGPDSRFTLQPSKVPDSKSRCTDLKPAGLPWLEKSNNLPPIPGAACGADLARGP
jgi:hypothetical protein